MKVSFISAPLLSLYKQVDILDILDLVSLEIVFDTYAESEMIGILRDVISNAHNCVPTQSQWLSQAQSLYISP